ncbi:hypothetical protein MY10362_009744, partial [Beauveria mimosiformis]
MLQRHLCAAIFAPRHGASVALTSHLTMLDAVRHAARHPGAEQSSVDNDSEHKFRL